MNQIDWEKGLLRSHRLEAKIFAQKLGLNYEYKHTSRSAYLSGNYRERFLSVELTYPIVGRSHYDYRIKCSLLLQLSDQFVFHSKEKSALLQFFQRSIPIAQQTGTTLIGARYKVSGSPQSFVDNLVRSPDFCYNALLLSPLVLEVNKSQFYCECKGENSYSYEIPLVLERFYAVASAIESTALGNL